MANRLKSKKSQASEKLKPEKDPQVTVKQIVKDERTHKITGAVFLLLAVFLFIAFTSYLFTWKEDQDKVFHGARILLPSSDVKVSNLLGNLGALIAHQFFYKGFGVASYLFCSFFFIVGVNLLFARKVFSIKRNLRYVVTGLIFFSVALAFVTRGNGFPWGGAVGDMISDWLVKFLGWVGTAALLLVTGLAYFIWRFNPVFKMPVLPVRERKPAMAEVEEEGSLPVPPVNGGARLFVDEGFSSMKGNVLKEEGGVVAIAPGEEEEMHRLELVERANDGPSDNGPGARFEEEDEDPPFEITSAVEEEEEPEVEIPPLVLPPVAPPVVPPLKGRQAAAAPELELEIKGPENTEAGEGMEGMGGEEAATGLPLPDYEPTLDLRDYKYPS
ncbi:MAG TPA: DNA translocase FtsK 4TM domain-containing protein, partial [Puia sp.]|nr:DNA translocase FtsK 4TM domain-containing protein [Puia sp.]